MRLQPRHLAIRLVPAQRSRAPLVAYQPTDANVLEAGSVASEAGVTRVSGIAGEARVSRIPGVPTVRLTDTTEESVAYHRSEVRPIGVNRIVVTPREPSDPVAVLVEEKLVRRGSAKRDWLSARVEIEDCHFDVPSNWMFSACQ